VQAGDQQPQIHDDQQDDRRFQDHHPTVILVVLQELVKIIEGFKFLVDGAMPIGQVKAGRDIVVVVAAQLSG
jgi:hypothetical protein